MKNKVFCIGFQKTGTTSLDYALQVLGYDVAGVFGRDWSLEALQKDAPSHALKLARDHDAVQDMPWPILFRTLDEHFPKAKFILTLRDEDAWWSSILGHFSSNPDVMQQYVYGEDAPAPMGNEYRYRSIYRSHNDAVLSYFKNRPEDLLVIHFPQDASWDALCAFLDHDMPDEPFPHKNQQFEDPGLRRTLRRALVYARHKFGG